MHISRAQADEFWQLYTLVLSPPTKRQGYSSRARNFPGAPLQPIPPSEPAPPANAAWFELHRKHSVYFFVYVFFSLKEMFSRFIQILLSHSRMINVYVVLYFMDV